ncbi:hypothetical protein BCR42DRAFT_398663 [Absidia repens]|uniref:Uncharacterized protein n=1 Tax=Absidia repens TaxID=90262 RepID=A0A1X2HXC9_9FUNG|nr:hypothetical protein BCR42DRAFT_398663 [Absidia repens]
MPYVSLFLTCIKFRSITKWSVVIITFKWADCLDPMSTIFYTIEDRFYSIPLLSDYKHKFINRNEVDKWNINSLMPVKLKLFEVMATKDKLNLLFMLGNDKTGNKRKVVPTLATSTITAENEWSISDAGEWQFSMQF